MSREEPSPDPGSQPPSADSGKIPAGSKHGKPWAGRESPRAAGLDLALRLYLVLLAICLPAFFLYYYYGSRTIRQLHQRLVEDNVRMATSRLADWITSVPPEGVDPSKREDLEREMKKIVEEGLGIDNIALFTPRGEYGLDLMTGYGFSVQETPSSEDLIARSDQRPERVEILRDGNRYQARSIPLRVYGKVIAVIHVEIAPAQIAPGLQNLQGVILLGALGLMAAMGVGVVMFFHLAVRQPIHLLIRAMKNAAQGRMGGVVASSRGEIARLAQSYNEMMGRLKLSMIQNRKLLRQVKSFNVELQQKVLGATRELSEKNAQLQTATEKLFSAQRKMTRIEKLASLGQLATVIAHELGTPLNAISGHLQLLLQEENEPAVTNRLKVIDGQVDRLTGIVRNVLDTMRMPPPRFMPVRLQQVVRGVVDLIVPVAEKKRIVVALMLQDGLPTIQGDAGQLEQLFMNLLTNAIDAMGGGGTLTVSAVYVAGKVLEGGWQEPDGGLGEGSFLEVRVADTGSGMDEDVIRQAFLPFFSTKRAPGSASPSFQSGMGLGLAICRQIVRNHHGDISVESQKGRGTTFKILLPVQAEKRVLQA